MPLFSIMNDILKKFVIKHCRGKKVSLSRYFGWSNNYIDIRREEKQTYFCMYESAIQIWYSKWPKQEAFIPFQQRNNSLWRIDKTKGFQRGVVNCWRSNKVCSSSLLGSKFPTSGDKDAFYPPSNLLSFPLGDLSFAFRGTEKGQSVLLPSAVS